MREALEPYLGGFGAFAAQLLIVFLFLGLIIAGVLWFTGFFKGTTGFGLARNRAPRLGVVDALPLDRDRQLVLVRRDQFEHLLLIGGPNDLVVEQSLYRGVPLNARLRPDQLRPAGQPAPVQPTPSMAPTPDAGRPSPPPEPAPPPRPATEATAEPVPARTARERPAAGYTSLRQGSEPSPPPAEPAAAPAPRQPFPDWPAPPAVPARPAPSLATGSTGTRLPARRLATDPSSSAVDRRAAAEPHSTGDEAMRLARLDARTLLVGLGAEDEAVPPAAAPGPAQPALPPPARPADPPPEAAFAEPEPMEAVEPEEEVEADSESERHTREAEAAKVSSLEQEMARLLGQIAGGRNKS